MSFLILLSYFIIIGFILICFLFTFLLFMEILMFLKNKGSNNINPECDLDNYVNYRLRKDIPRFEMIKEHLKQSKNPNNPTEKELYEYRKRQFRLEAIYKKYNTNFSADCGKHQKEISKLCELNREFDNKYCE
jgi:hypothetical protein